AELEGRPGQAPRLPRGSRHGRRRAPRAPPGDARRPLAGRGAAARRRDARPLLGCGGRGVLRYRAGPRGPDRPPAQPVRLGGPVGVVGGGRRPPPARRPDRRDRVRAPRGRDAPGGRPADGPLPGWVRPVPGGARLPPRLAGGGRGGLARGPPARGGGAAAGRGVPPVPADPRGHRGGGRGAGRPAAGRRQARPGGGSDRLRVRALRLPGPHDRSGRAGDAAGPARRRRPPGRRRPLMRATREAIVVAPATTQGGNAPMRFARAVLVAAAAMVLAAAGPALAQTFVMGIQGEPVQFDPAVITDGISAWTTNQVYDPLVRYKGSTTEVIPALAEKWSVSADGKVWTLEIRKNVKFHDGEPLDAAAVVWNFERWWHEKHPQHENQVKAGQTFEYWEGQFEGFDDKSIVEKVEAVGSHTVKVTLKRPQAPFLQNLGIFSFGIASPKAVEKWGTEFGKHPVGTGAFKFVEWKPNQEVVLEANPDYWGPKARIKRLVFRNIKDNSQRFAALKAGEIHGMEGLNADDIKVVKSDPNLQLLLRPANTTGYVAFNYKVREFQDKRVREAFAHAINKKAIVDALYGGTGIVATNFQPPALWGHNKALKDFEYST